MAETVG